MPARKITHVAAACLALASAFGALAQETTENARGMSFRALVESATLEDLASIVVTDTKVAQSRNSVTQNIAVLQSADMERQPVNNRNIAELLRYTSGQFVNVLSRNDANWGAYAGLGPKYNSYLLDGLPIDAFVDPMSLDYWALERIEAHKGPASVMYPNYLSMDFAGNEAPLAGITNLVLKDRIDEAQTRIQAGFGTDNTRTARAYHQDRAGNLSYFVGAGGESSDYAQHGVRNSWLQAVDDPDYRKNKLYGKASYAFDRPDHTISLFAHYTSHHGDLGRPNRDFAHTYGTLNFAYRNQLNEAWNLQFKAGDRYYDRVFGEDDYPRSLASAGHGEVRQRIRPLDFTLSFKHWGSSLLTAGIDRQTVDYQTWTQSPDGVFSPGNDVQGRSQGIYLQEKVEWKDFVFRAGVRRTRVEHDYNLLGGNGPVVRHAEWRDTLWSLGARYNVSPGFSVYANAGSSFMPPAAKQIGGTIPFGSTANGQLPNPSLNPESGIGSDFGVDWKPVSTLTVGVRVFRNEISSAIVDNVVVVSPSVSQAVSTNAGSATATGVELNVRHVPSSNWQWFANLTASRTRVRSPLAEDRDGTEIPFAPNLVANLGVSARLAHGIDVTPYYQWVGRYYDSDARSSRTGLGNYGVLNARIRKELVQKAGYSLSLILYLNNVLDRKYRLPFAFQDPGFNAWAGLDLRF